MAALASEGDVDVFEDSDDERDTFCLENTTWKKLEEQKHKVAYGVVYSIDEVIRNVISRFSEIIK